MSITFEVSGDPKAQPRARAFAMKMGGGKFSARIYDAGTAEGWKGLIAMAARPHAPTAPMLGPVSVTATFIFARPNKHFMANNPARELRSDAPHWHTNKPDRDNLEKALLDSLTQLGSFWRDDTQVCAGEVIKKYGPKAGLSVTIREIGA